MTPAAFVADFLDPALARLGPVLIGVPNSDEARVEMTAIGGIEGGWRYRRQLANGPARSCFMFERDGGVAEVLQKCAKQIGAVCSMLEIPGDRATIYEAMAWNDTLAVAMARLLLWQDPKPLPELGAVRDGWDYYFRNWRPGSPRPSEWPGYYASAAKACGISAAQLHLEL